MPGLLTNLSRANKRVCGKKSRKATILIISICLISISMCYTALVSTAKPGSPSIEYSTLQAQVQNPNVQYADNKVFLGIWLINIFNYQYTSNDYTLDMYLYFFWTNSNLSTIDWQFVNGYPITPSSITLVSSNNASAVKYEVYRATARFNSQPDASNFPFDKINLTISISVLPRGNNISLYWLNNDTGIDSQFENSGWKTDNIELQTSNTVYPLGTSIPNAKMIITQERQKLSQSIPPFIPPLIFSFVCAISFMFGLKDKEAIAVRLALITSMLVTTLLFDFTVSNGIPPASTLVIYNIFFLSVISFMFVCLTVTIVGAVDLAKNNDPKRSERINKLGLLIAVIAPLIIFFVTLLLRP